MSARFAYGKFSRAYGVDVVFYLGVGFHRLPYVYIGEVLKKIPGTLHWLIEKYATKWIKTCKIKQGFRIVVLKNGAKCLQYISVDELLELTNPEQASGRSLETLCGLPMGFVNFALREEKKGKSRQADQRLTIQKVVDYLLNNLNDDGLGTCSVTGVTFDLLVSPLARYFGRQAGLVWYMTDNRSAGTVTAQIGDNTKWRILFDQPAYGNDAGKREAQGEVRFATTKNGGVIFALPITKKGDAIKSAA